ncbi:hypothetical protein FRC06_001834 [Ceratobasidium sp. 370]|nr:hypothetical protein FRC06_001834 [Ceratobasidium sp. 370]
MSAHVSPKPPMSMSMSMPTPAYASDSTTPIFDIGRVSATFVVPTNPPDNPFSNDDCCGSSSPILASRLPDIGQHGEADMSLGLRRLDPDSIHLPNRNDAGSHRSASEHECSASFEATQSLAHSLLQMRALARGRPPGRMPQAPISGPSSRVHPPAGLAVPRVSTRPIPTFELAPTVPLPESPWAGSARARHRLYGEENTADDASAVLTEANNTVDEMPVPYQWVGVSDSDDESDFPNGRAERPEILLENSPFGATINGYSPAVETHHTTPRTPLPPIHPLVNDEEVDYIFNFPSGTPTPAPRPSCRGEAVVSDQSPALHTAPPCTSLDSLTNTSALVPLPDREPAMPSPVQSQQVPFSGSNDWPVFKSWRTGRLATIPDDLPNAMVDGYKDIDGLCYLSSPNPLELDHSIFFDDRSPLGEHFDREQEYDSLSFLVSAYSLSRIPSHLPLSMDNSNDKAYSAVNTLPLLRTPSPGHQTAPEDQALPPIQALSLPTLKKPESAESRSLVTRETGGRYPSSAVALHSSTHAWDEIEAEESTSLMFMEAERYDAGDEDEDD